MNIKKKKVNFIAIIGMMVAIGTVAFTAPKENMKTAEKYWFLVDSSGDPLPGPIDVNLLDEECPDKLSEPDCAKQYDATNTEMSGGTRQVIPTEIDEYEDHRTKTL